MKKLKVGIVGLGQRGIVLLTPLCQMEDVEIVAVCDCYEDRIEEAIKAVEENAGYTPWGTTDYHEIIKTDEIEAIVIAAAWELHVEIATDAMRAGKYVGVEVGGAYSVEDCWKLVRTSEETGTKCMFLENCCYTEYEMMCLNMAKKGLFGEIVHCTGGYHHDLRDEISSGNEIRHYRLRNYTLRNCDNYPTHQLGPICKILNINRGNRMLSLTSMASKAVSLHEFAKENSDKYADLVNTRFAQADVVTTTIKCAGGETITLTLNTTMPGPYSRNFTVNGTKGCYNEENQSVFLEKDKGNYTQTYDEWSFDWRKSWGNADEYAKTYAHPLWKKYKEDGVKEGHGGGDWLVLRAFVESAIENLDPPMDVYDAAAWMSISALSEESVAMGGLPVAIPDFTNGKWVNPKPQKLVEAYRLDKIPEIK